MLALSGWSNKQEEESMARKTSKGQRKIHQVMKEKKEGTLKSSSGKKVTSRKQAVAIALSEARRAGRRFLRRKGPETANSVFPVLNLQLDSQTGCDHLS
jgi:hypothetical protein